MVKKALILMAVLLGLSTASPAGAAHNGTCHQPPLDTWSKTEQWVWTQTCKGKVADIAASGLKDNRLRAKFLETILLAEPWTQQTTRQGVRIIGARVEEPLNLSNATIEHPLWLDKSTFTSISLAFATMHAPLTFDGSTVTGTLNMEKLKTTSRLLMNGGATFKDINLLSANIGGQLNFIGSTVIGTLRMANVKTASDLYMHGGGTFKSVSLTGADIGGQLTLNGSTVTGTLAMHRLQVATDLFMSDGATLTEANLTNANIGGALILAMPNGTRATWTGDAPILMLSNAQVTAIWDHPEAWPENLILHGFAYADFGIGETDMSGREQGAEWLIRWLEKSQPFSPQPYEQLATVLNAHGHAAKADQVLYAKFERERDASSGWERFFLSVQKVVVGYGYHPFWALGWLAGVIFVGTLCAKMSRHESLPNWWECTEYAADMVVPVVKFRAEHNAIDHANRYVRLYFYAHQLSGYFLAYYVISAMTRS